MLNNAIEIGQLASIGNIFSKHYKEWCLLSFSYMEDMSEAEDMVQDVFVKILGRDNFGDIRNLKSYVSTAVRNTCLKRIQCAKRLEKIKEHKLTVFPSHEEYLIEEEMRGEVREALVMLPKKTKQVFELCVFEGLTYEMTANILDVSVNTIKFHLKKAFKMLRCTLRDNYFQ